MGSVQEVVPMELIVSEEIDSEFLEIVKPILRNKEFLKLGKYLQHQKTSRLEHSINVSYIAAIYNELTGCAFNKICLYYCRIYTAPCACYYRVFLWL